MKLSKLCLGTAQLGLDYGVNNLTGKPRFEESRAIIQTALESGITAFDTAPAYGDSEEILGP
jgi:aryl-alcohol dehydrogenase-like predicted oxidoreductase